MVKVGAQRHILEDHKPDAVETTQPGDDHTESAPKAEQVHVGSQGKRQKVTS